MILPRRCRRQKERRMMAVGWNRYATRLSDKRAIGRQARRESRIRTVIVMMLVMRNGLLRAIALPCSLLSYTLTRPLHLSYSSFRFISCALLENHRVHARRLTRVFIHIDQMPTMPSFLPPTRYPSLLLTVLMIPVSPKSSSPQPQCRPSTRS